MGGSSLAPEVLRRTFSANALHVLDTTHPDAIRALEDAIDLERTLFVSASKSGSTLETRSHSDYFWKKTGKGAQWVAVTDPGSQLEALAKERGFRGVFHGEPTIGGRYSALSPFGMVPVALIGIDVDPLLQSAESMAERCRSDEGNPGYELGAAFGSGWSEGRDKICIAESDGGFGLWAEQLIAESTGKLGKGLVPAPGESPEGPDRQWATPDLDGAATLGGEFFRWEFAVAVASSASQASSARARAASSHTGTARATCTPRDSCTRAARTRASSCRSSTTAARSSRFPASRSASAGSSARRPRATSNRSRSAAGVSRASTSRRRKCS